MRLLTLLIIGFTIFCLWEREKGVESTYTRLSTFYNGDLIQEELGNYTVTETSHSISVNNGTLVAYDSKMSTGNKDVMYFVKDTLVAKYRYKENELTIVDRQEMYVFNQY